MFKAGLSKTASFETLNKVCASGMIAVAHERPLDRAGRCAVVVAGGMESMSNGPYALLDARFGYRFGDGRLVDLTSNDGLVEPFTGWTMAESQAKVNAELGISREVQDELAYRSHVRAAEATNSGAFAEEIVPLRVALKAKGKLVVDRIPVQARPRIPVGARSNGYARSPLAEPPDALAPDPSLYSPYVTGDVPFTLVDRDEPIRFDASLEAMRKLRPLDAGGTVTAGNAPGVNDGGAALVLASAEYIRANGREPLGAIVDHAAAAWDPAYLSIVPAMAIAKLLQRHGLTAAQIDVWEVNEAFAAVAWSTATYLGIDPEEDQPLGRRSCARPSGGSLRGAHHRLGGASAPPSRRRPRDRRVMQRRRPR